jgi:hypothetical protein
MDYFYVITILVAILLAIGGLAAAAQMRRRAEHQAEGKPIVVEDDQVR